MAVLVAGLLVMGSAAVVGAAGCAGIGESEVTTTTAAMASRASATTAGPATTTTWVEGDYGEEDGAAVPGSSSGVYPGPAAGGTLTAAAAAAGQKIISDAQLEIEVETGRFQAVFDQAVLLADRYGGYLVSSTSYASGEDGSMKSGTVAIRVPSTSFAQALSDAAKLGTLKNESLSTQDVTEEYVDLEARIKNAEAYVASLTALLGKAETIDDSLQVQSVLSRAQEELEALKGRMRYLEEHTSYSTITMSIYEAGVEFASDEGWGVVAALEDGLHNLVKAFNAIIRGLGVLVPVLVVLAIIAYLVYRAWRVSVRRRREAERERYQPYPQGPGGRAVYEGQVGAPAAGRAAAEQAGAVPAPGPGSQTAPPAATQDEAAMRGPDSGA
ncbi:MAG: DUF4349 domain-containing protein [Actinomycetia bacterium]|nr:DUF4349 domain-containing protein [Actinomycetes bacterium]